jgi:hypothetical protein
MKLRYLPGDFIMLGSDRRPSHECIVPLWEHVDAGSMCREFLPNYTVGLVLATEGNHNVFVFAAGRFGWTVVSFGHEP